MENKPTYIWDEESGVATCTIYYNKIPFSGMAFCHENDRDMMSEKTGMLLAEMRAVIEAEKWRRNCEVLPALNALKEYANAIEHTANVPKRVKGILYHRINGLEDELASIKYTINYNKKYINKYITEKDEFYNKIRKNREKGKIE